ncbi:MAG: diaminopimelate decarboxylase [Bacteroidaceae bacterium]|nr:diaminopimelate decarboxylase [Bacteroidaceae bacterium]
MEFPIDRFRELQTPFYYYDTALLGQTLQTAQSLLMPDWHIHYAVKACTNPGVMHRIAEAGLGADCVSGGEIRAALAAGFPSESIVFAGVGKSDWEIELALGSDIFCFNVESIPELEVIQEIAQRMGRTARVAFRINPNVGAHTHENITTGRAENKFGIAMEDMVGVVRLARTMANVECIGLHFHIGSQILDMEDFATLSLRINELQEVLASYGFSFPHVNVGGGLGIDYEHPDLSPIPNFKDYFDTFKRYLRLHKGQQLHFELGRSLVGQCGTLVTKVLYVKQGNARQFVITDAGMTDLIRPALYDAQHKIENLMRQSPLATYDVVGPICESSDVFARDYRMAETRRGDLLALRSSGAYGEIMASQYNCRPLPKGYLTEQL